MVGRMVSNNVFVIKKKPTKTYSISFIGPKLTNAIFGFGTIERQVSDNSYILSTGFKFNFE